MANVHEVTAALKRNVSKFAQYLAANYVTPPDDIDYEAVYHDEPFDIEKEDALKTRFTASNYHFVITNVSYEPRSDYPSGAIIWEFTADVYVIRRMLQVKDLTNNANLLLSGGVDGAGATVTSMGRVCGDLAKYLRSVSLGGKLPDDNEDATVFIADVTSISNLLNTGNFYYCLCQVSAQTIEYTTISTT